MWAYEKCSSKIRGKGKECVPEFSRKSPKRAISLKAAGYKVKLM